MMVVTIALVITFGTSSRLAGAYGTAVSTTMLLTTVLLYYAMRQVCHWPLTLVLPLAAVFLVVDFVFFAANLLKIRDGGWIPPLLALVLFAVMTTWRAGMDALRRAQSRHSESVDDFLREIARHKGARVPGTAVFLMRLSERVPPLLLQHVRQIGAIPQTIVALTVRFVDRPRIPPEQKIELHQFGSSFWQLTVRYGFFESPNVPATFAPRAPAIPARAVIRRSDLLRRAR
jgi:KUP system potassium uptake protein